MRRQGIHTNSLVETPFGKCILGGPKRRWEGNITTDLEDIVYEDNTKLMELI
jgi:hypothetical protein